jgi:hypothetical protein
MKLQLLWFLTVLFCAGFVLVNGYSKNGAASPLNVIGLWRRLIAGFQRGMEQSIYEQALEDRNLLFQQLELQSDRILKINRQRRTTGRGKLDTGTINRINSKFKLTRDLIILPFSARQSKSVFNPGFDARNSDKCSFPASIGKYINQNRLEAPWMFKIVRKRGVNSIGYNGDNGIVLTEDVKKISDTTMSSKREVYVSVYDFNSLENYLFVPDWVLAAVGATAGDTVRIEWQSSLQAASHVILKPMAANTANAASTVIWSKDSAPVSSQLETTLSQFSVVTNGTTIAIRLGEEEQFVSVIAVENAQGVPMKAGAVQDSDVRVSIDLK